MMIDRRILFVAGGTGGHLQPGFVLARALRRKHPHWKQKFLLSGRAIERRFVPDDTPASDLFPGLEGRPPFWRADRYCAALLRARSVVHEFHPHLIVHLGGYVSAVAHLAAPHAPSVCLESNCRPGKSVRLLRRSALRVFFQWPPAPGSGFGRDQVRVTGMPTAFEQVPDPTVARIELGLRPELPTLLVVGGSQGSRALNQMFLKGAAELARSGVQILHITGPADFPKVKQVYLDLGLLAAVHPFLERMDLAYGAADLVVARAGGMTVAELTMAGKPAVLVPYPHHADLHQEANALALVAREAAWLVHEMEAGDSFVTRDVMPRLFHRRELNRRGANALALRRTGATEQIIKEIELLFERELESSRAA